jgi:hypothetical protein
VSGRLALLALLVGLVCRPAEASRVVLLVDSHRLLELDVPAQHLLPDGRVIEHDRLIRACGPSRTSGWVVYDPASEGCRQAIGMALSFQLPEYPQASGVVVFDRVSRQQCDPGACQVLVGAPLGDPLFTDRFEASP